MIRWWRRWVMVGIELRPVQPRPLERTGLVRILVKRPPVLLDWRREGWA